MNADSEIFRETFKRHAITVSREFGSDWYITVLSPEGLYAYDGWWRDSAHKSRERVITQAKIGAMLQPKCEHARYAPTGERCQKRATKKWGQHWFCDEHGSRKASAYKVQPSQP